MASMYDIPDYSSGSVYIKNDIVKSANYYWYALKDVPVSQTPVVGSVYWGGVISTAPSTHSSALKVSAPHFIWKPAYNFSGAHSPRVKVISFGDGYEQRFKDGINNNLLELSLTFDGRKVSEARAILHFLEARNGVDFFFYRPPSPYDSMRKFKCQEFSSSIEFKDRVNVSANFRQVP